MSEYQQHKQAKKSTEGEFRCFSCDKLLAKGGVISGGLNIKCIRCGNVNYIFDDADEFIFFTDAKGTIVYASDNCKTLTGYDAGEVLGKTPAIWGRQMPGDFYKDLWHQILEEKKAITTHVTNRRKDGTLFQALVRISPILDEHGDVHVFLGRQKVDLAGETKA